MSKYSFRKLNFCSIQLRKYHISILFSDNAEHEVLLEQQKRPSFEVIPTQINLQYMCVYQANLIFCMVNKPVMHNTDFYLGFDFDRSPIIVCISHQILFDRFFFNKNNLRKVVYSITQQYIGWSKYLLRCDDRKINTFQAKTK